MENLKDTTGFEKIATIQEVDQNIALQETKDIIARITQKIIEGEKENPFFQRQALS